MTGRYLVMGAHGGIGEDVAKRLLQDGHSVLATARDSSSITVEGAETLSVDVFQKDQIEQAVSQADRGEGLQGLVYAVGSINLKPFGKTTDQDYMDTFQLNFLGAVQVLRAAEEALKKGQGSVVLYSTIAVQQGFPSHAAIASAKGAIEGLVRTLAAEWAGKVRVNGIAPSLTDTEIAGPITGSEQMADTIAKMHPVPRLGKPEDSGAMSAFLLSEQASWITGQIMHVDGGRSHVRHKG